MSSITRVYLELPLHPNASVTLPDAAAHHLVQVMRLRPGDAFIAFNGHGGEFDAVLDKVERKAVRARIGAHHEVSRESPLPVSLAQCVSKGERMDYVMQKAAELGAIEVQPLLSNRCVVRLDEERWAKKLEHWRGIAIAAAEQCGRTRVPVIKPVIELAAWLEQPHAELRLVLMPSANEALRALEKPDRPIAILTGPEGGLDDDEERLAIRHGCEPISLGPRLLRTETAGIAALAALQAIFGDLA